jgi:hypothetical protein
MIQITEKRKHTLRFTRLNMNTIYDLSQTKTKLCFFLGPDKFNDMSDILTFSRC